jgi:hypothetical protein
MMPQVQPAVRLNLGEVYSLMAGLQVGGIDGSCTESCHVQFR